MPDNNPQVISPLPGPVVLFGSGETSASGRKVYDRLMNGLPQPIRVAILETPAGFQPNTTSVAADVSDFLCKYLPNYHPQITIVPARKRGTAFSPDDSNIVAPITSAGIIFMGAGSPTYTVRQLQDSLAWYTVLACHRQGAAVVLASAATIAAGVRALPVYEIYKVGEDLHWVSGLDLLGGYGLMQVFVPHWNNNDGGDGLDTSRCFMGRARFAELLAMLPPGINVTGIDEHTALVIDIANRSCLVMGQGVVTLLKQGNESRYSSGQTFDITEIGDFHMMEPHSGIPSGVWRNVLAARSQPADTTTPTVTPEVISMLQARENARLSGDWSTADTLRRQIYDLGWQVIDRQNGPQLVPRIDAATYPLT